MTVSLRAIMVTRLTEYEELLSVHGTRQQVAFFLQQRGGSLDELDKRHRLQQTAMQKVSASIPVEWRRASLRRDDLAQFVFGPEDVIIAIGQDGLIANVAKYLDGQPVLGIQPEHDRSGVLAFHDAETTKNLLQAIAEGNAAIEQRAMVEIDADDGQKLLALNEIFVGHETHQSAKYCIEVEGIRERHSSSGVVIGTGTGSTGWCKSIYQERQCDWCLPMSVSRDLAWFVREAWSSSWTQTSLTAGLVKDGSQLTLSCESDRLVAFGDGIENDRIELTTGQQATIKVAQKALTLVVKQSRDS